MDELERLIYSFHASETGRGIFDGGIFSRRRNVDELMSLSKMFFAKYVGEFPDKIETVKAVLRAVPKTFAAILATYPEHWGE